MAVLCFTDMTEVKQPAQPYLDSKEEAVHFVVRLLSYEFPPLSFHFNAFGLESLIVFPLSFFSVKIYSFFPPTVNFTQASLSITPLHLVVFKDTQTHSQK